MGDLERQQALAVDFEQSKPLILLIPRGLDPLPGIKDAIIFASS